MRLMQTWLNSACPERSVVANETIYVDDVAYSLHFTDNPSQYSSTASLSIFVNTSKPSKHAPEVFHYPRRQSADEFQHT